MQALKEKKTPECILRSCPEVVEVRIPERKYREYNGENIIIHCLRVTECLGRVNRTFIRGLAEFIVAPIIIDRFPSNLERNLWTKRLKESSPQVHYFFELNKLRATNITKPLSILKTNVLGVDRPSWQNDIAEVNAFITASDGYENLSVKHKVEVAEQLTRISYHAYDEIVSKLNLLQTA